VPRYFSSEHYQHHQAAADNDETDLEYLTGLDDELEPDGDDPYPGSDGDQDYDDDVEDYEGLYDDSYLDPLPERRARRQRDRARRRDEERYGDPSTRNPDAIAPRVVAEGRSGRAEVDLDRADEDAGGELRVVDAPFSSYDVATHGPGPAPGWLVTALSARDTRLGPLKSGKEADVTLLERAVPDGPSCLLAVKTYRGAEHRLFHRDAGYQEGRRVRRSRETRAMAKRTVFGRDLLASQWAVAEFGALCALWTSGARVPYPVQIIGSELMMQFIGSPAGTAAPRLAAHDASSAEFTDLWHDLVATLEVLAGDGMTHGDLSAYNVLVDPDGCVLIDLPQVVDLIGNPQGMAFLQRDCRVIAEFFSRRGVAAADGELLADHLRLIATPAG
jgi:RIO kinase 1